MDKESLKIPFRIIVTEETFYRIKKDLQQKIAYPDPKNSNSLHLGSKVIFDTEGFQILSTSTNPPLDQDVIRYIEKIEKRLDLKEWLEKVSAEDLMTITGLSNRDDSIKQVNNDFSSIIGFFNSGNIITWDDYEVVIVDFSSSLIEKDNKIIAIPGLIVFIALAIWGLYNNWILKLWSKFLRLFRKPDNSFKIK